MGGKERMENKKTLFVTYNSVNGFPTGFYEDDSVITVSGDYGRGDFGFMYSMAEDNETKERIRETAKLTSEAVMIELREGVGDLLDRVSKGFIYTGISSQSIAGSMAKTMKSKGIDATIVGCDCGENEKRAIARDTGVSFLLSECGGIETMGNLARDSYKK